MQADLAEDLPEGGERGLSSPELQSGAQAANPRSAGREA